MTLYSYVVDHDNGFAPNPFHGFCTLACCKPAIRRKAQVGDYVIGHAGIGDGYRVIYAMEVTDKKTFDEYWRGQRFHVKRPDMDAGGEKALGDNIYRWDAKRQEYRQERSRHSNPDGTENLKNKIRDTQDDAVLISDKFTYWGGQSPDDPPFLINIVKHGPGHKSKANDPYIPHSRNGSPSRNPAAWVCLPTVCPNRPGRASASAGRSASAPSGVGAGLRRGAAPSP